MELVLEAGVRLGVPLLFVALAGLISERSGVLNLGLEGFMVGGAFIAAWAAAGADAWWLGALAAPALGAVLGFLVGLAMVNYRADQVVMGIMFVLLMYGATSYLTTLVTQGGREPGAVRVTDGLRVNLPVLSDLPLVGSAIFGQHALVYVGLALVPILHFVLYRTGLGIRLRAAGEFAEGAQAMGVNLARCRLGAVVASGALASLGGAQLVLVNSRFFVERMTAGRGFIALAVIILGRWNPWGVLAAALLIGGADAMQLGVQARGLPIPGQAALAAPYVVTLVAVGILGRRVRPPAELARPLP